MKSIKLLSTFVLASLLLTSCSTKTFDPKSYTSEKLEENISISINASYRDISIYSSKEDQLKVDYFENEEEFYTISLENNLFKMDLKNTSNNPFTTQNRNQQKIDVYIPEGKLVDLTITNSAGTINLNQISFETAALNNNNGNITFDSINFSKSLDILLKSGDLQGSIADSKENIKTNIQIKKGDSNISNNLSGDKSLNIDVNNGDIKLSFNS